MTDKLFAITIIVNESTESRTVHEMAGLHETHINIKSSEEEY